MDNRPQVRGAALTSDDHQDPFDGLASDWLNETFLSDDAFDQIGGSHIEGWIEHVGFPKACVISIELRSSMGIPAPLDKVRSKVLLGAAT
jgi:hypothetical protein